MLLQKNPETRFKLEVHCGFCRYFSTRTARWPLIEICGVRIWEQTPDSAAFSPQYSYSLWIRDLLNNRRFPLCTVLTIFQPVDIHIDVYSDGLKYNSHLFGATVYGACSVTTLYLFSSLVSAMYENDHTRVVGDRHIFHPFHTIIYGITIQISQLSMIAERGTSLFCQRFDNCFVSDS